MVSEIKELTVTRSRKYSQNYNSIGYDVSITFSGDDLAEMRRDAIGNIAMLEDHEKKRCQNILDLMAHEETIGKSGDSFSSEDMKSLPESNNMENLSEKPIKELEKGEMIFFANLENCTILEQVGKTYKILKDGYTTYLALSHIDETILQGFEGLIEEGGLFGKLFDILLRNDRKWILKKKKDGKPNLEWKVYTP